MFWRLTASGRKTTFAKAIKSTAKPIPKELKRRFIVLPPVRFPKFFWRSRKTFFMLKKCRTFRALTGTNIRTGAASFRSIWKNSKPILPISAISGPSDARGNRHPLKGKGLSFLERPFLCPDYLRILFEVIQNRQAHGRLHDRIGSFQVFCRQQQLGRSLRLVDVFQ